MIPFQIHPRNLFGDTPAHFAAQNGYFEAFTILIKYGVDKNPKNYNGTTALHFAAYHGHFNICQLITDNVTQVCGKYFNLSKILKNIKFIFCHIKLFGESLGKYCDDLAKTSELHT